MPKTKRVLTDLVGPLPTTFAPGQSIATWRTRQWLDPSPRVGEPHHDYPYRYYEICLQRSLVGLDKKTRYVAQSLGLFSRHQVVRNLRTGASAQLHLKDPNRLGVENRFAQVSRTDPQAQGAGERSSGPQHSRKAHPPSGLHQDRVHAVRINCQRCSTKTIPCCAVRKN